MNTFYNRDIEKIKQELILRNHKPLETGEIVLLARAISDNISLKNINLTSKDIVLKYKIDIYDIIKFINHYTFIEEDQEEILFECIEGFLSWRLNLISEPVEPLFVSGDNYFVDEISLITRFIDAGLLCSVCSMYNNAQYTYSLFRNLVKNIFKRKLKDS